jgi:hypothetical protein
MLKIYLKLRAKKDIGNTGWKEGEILEMVNNVFDESCGIAYFPLDKDWEILNMEIKEFKNIQK